MAVATRMHGLKAALASSCQLLTDSESADFRKYAKQWSDIDRQIPAAIVLPTTEEDIQKIVNRCLMFTVSELIYPTGSMGCAGVDSVCGPERRS